MVNREDTSVQISVRSDGESRGIDNRNKNTGSKEEKDLEG